MKRKDGFMHRLVQLVLAAGCAVAFVGCTPLSAGFIAVTDGRYILAIPEKCERKIVSVRVAYYSDSSESNPDIWAANAELDAASNQVVLFQPNEGYMTEGEVGGIDFSKELIIGWGEGESDITAGVTGILANLEPDKVLWANGITSAKEYETDMNHAVPGTYLCLPKKR